MTATSTAPAALRRRLGLPGVVLFGLAYMAPLIVLGTFGIVAATTAGTVPSAYLLALVAMLFTAASYGKMAAAHPVAGSAYTYVRKAIDARAGFLVGWAVLLDYFFLPMVIWLIGGAYLSAEFPGVPRWVWLIAFIVLTTLLNVLGIKVAEKANFVLMAFQLLVIGFFVALSIRHVLHAGEALASTQPFFHAGSTLGTISGGAALATYSFLGFDAVTTLTEETTEPQRTIPRAILLTALIGGGIFVALAYFTQLAHPGSAFADESSAAFEIATTIGGDLFASVFLAGLVVAQFASGIAAQASASRLMFAMGRDGVLPRVFGKLHPRFATPAFGILLTGAVGLAALALDVSTSTSFINFGAFTAFTFVNLSVLATWLRDRTGKRALTWLVFPLIGVVVDLWLLVNLDGIALVFGLV
ncbi:APC family permease [Amycolatopsis sp. Poz14]|uniref:APC family permease n=1 Tax=Amycolatopsis sp. Poz14 TaxID=1447705 RepID=UPI001EE79934|nr:amino acid permease [Amycolatopsis sp. Poz14]